jgi:hypothetical protein
VPLPVVVQDPAVQTRPSSWLFPVALAFLVGCPDPITNPASNTPPSILIESPVQLDGEPPEFPADQGVVFTASVIDAEDRETDLAIAWSGLQTDEPGAVALALGTSTADSQGDTQFVLGGIAAGNWTITGTVTDTDGATDSQSVDIVLLSQNDPPQVAITSPADGAVVSEGEDVDFVGTAFDDSGAANLEVVWSSSLSGTLNALPPSSSGLLGFTLPGMAVGEHVITLTATDEGGLEATDTIGLTVLEQNLPPTQPTVEITPANPFTGDGLRCLVLVASTDPEGSASLTMTYQWLVDGVPVGVSSDEVDASETARGEDWTCRVTGNDGTQDGPAGSDTVTIANTVPHITSVTILPTTAYEATTLTCLAGGWSDADGDAPGYVYAWMVNSGVLPGATAETLDGADFDRGDSVQCQATPTDGVDAGVQLTSGAVTIQNSAPSDPTLLLSPSPVAAITDPLVCQASGSVDDDGDAVTYSLQWLVDGVHEPAWDGVAVIPWTQTELGEEWTCEAWATDGDDDSNVVSASVQVLPGVGDVVITEFLADPTAVADIDGEWVELYNRTAQSLNLNGFRLHDDATPGHTIVTDLYVAPGAYVVLGRNANPAVNGGVTVDRQYSGFVLEDDIDQIVLSFDGLEIDRVDYDLTSYAWSLESASSSLDPDLGDPDPGLNDDPSSWCASSTLLAGLTGDFGTPGEANDTCACSESDGDGDGFGIDGSCGLPDCDDGDAAVSPAGVETCNGIDDDCDGDLDEGCNDPPTVTHALLGPDPAYEDSILTCSGVGFYDPDGDPEGYTYAWLLAGNPIIGATSATLNGASFSRGDSIACVLTPWDGQVYGPAVTSNAIVISNTSPTAPSVSLTPSPTALQSQTLTCSASGSTDIDGDPVTYLVRWSIDGVPDPAFDGAWAIASSETALGEEWTCEARASDGGGGYSAWVPRSTTIMPAVGAIVISEVMVDPTVVGDASGEWIEVYNASAQPIDLLGFEIHDDAADSHVIAQSVVVGAGQYALLARNADPLLNGGVSADYDYSGISMSNGQDQVVLEFLGREVDRVEYDLSIYGNNLAGAAWSLDSDLGTPDAVENDLPGSWCGATTPLSSPGSDFGTPGVANPSCACWYSDGDGDNYGDHATCTLLDCNDASAASNPEAVDVCENGQDEDCDGSDAICDCLATDGDGDGFGDGLACSPVDCNDNNPNINPNATETCDGVDQDCDGLIDENFDLDLDTWTTCEGDCNDNVPTTHPFASETCNGVDDDCDGSVDEGFDNDIDGFTSCGGDCNDANNTISPAAVETCDSVDQNCDGTPDNGVPSVMCPPTNSASTTACTTGSCQVTGCSSGFFDIDGLYGNGCECVNDLAGATCGTSRIVGSLTTGQSMDMVGVLPVSTGVDWFTATFPRSGRPGGGTPRVQFISNPGGTHTFDVFLNCAGTQATCGNAPDALGLTDYTFVDSGSPGWTINNVAWPDTVYVRVQRSAGAPSCSSYQLRFSR